MTYLTMEAEIDHGRVTPAEPEKLPPTGEPLLTVSAKPVRANRTGEKVRAIARHAETRS